MMKLNKVKIIFFDIDGTLLEMGKTEITPNMRKALCSLKQNGIKICIATGRPFVTIPMFEGIVLMRFWHSMVLFALQGIK